MARKPPVRAIALPLIPAIRAWLSLVGMPKYQATTAHSTMEKSAAASAMEVSASSLPKSTIFSIVSVTAGDNLLIISTPRRLKTAERKTAFFKVMQRVVMQVATAFGASVRPFTKITEAISTRVVIVSGDNPPRNENKKITTLLTLYSSGWLIINQVPPVYLKSVQSILYGQGIFICTF